MSAVPRIPKRVLIPPAIRQQRKRLLLEQRARQAAERAKAAAERIREFDRRQRQAAERAARADARRDMAGCHLAPVLEVLD